MKSTVLRLNLKSNLTHADVNPGKKVLTYAPTHFHISKTGCDCDWRSYFQVFEKKLVWLKCTLMVNRKRNTLLMYGPIQSNMVHFIFLLPVELLWREWEENAHWSFVLKFATRHCYRRENLILIWQLLYIIIRWRDVRREIQEVQ